MASFFYCGRLSSAQLVPLQAPKHRPIISPHPVEQTEFRRGIKRQWIINPSLTSTEQVVDKGIMHSLTAVPFVRGHRSVFPGTPRNTGVYTRHPTFVTAGRRGHDDEWRVDTASGKTLDV